MKDDELHLRIAVVASRMALHIMANAIAEMSDGQSHPTRETLELWDKVIAEALYVLDAVDPDLSDLYEKEQSPCNKPH